MRAVLGIDAAWTATQPSGLAVAIESDSGWRLIGVATSYGRFHDWAEGHPLGGQRPSGSSPDAPSLLSAASKLCQRSIDLVAIDMPLAHTPIVGRRFCDDEVSRAYGARKCGTHSPSAIRPGRISDDLKTGFERAGYPLLTNAVASPGVIEVYPHPALVELASASIRLPYKASRVRSYWPSATASERRLLLYQKWGEIVSLLDAEIAGVAAALPGLDVNAGKIELKAYEDSLDAVVCAWVGICALEGKGRPFGDENSAIWIPNARTASHLSLPIEGGENVTEPGGVVGT
jgi:predicted RNase H-like nuclease